MATYYFRSTGTNWGTAGDWSSTPSPTYTAGAVPTTLDDVIFEAASANCTINAGATRNCKTLTCTSYAGILTFSTGLSVLGNVTLGSTSMSTDGSSTLTLLATSISALTLSSSGCTCSVPLATSKASGGTLTITMSTNWIQTGNFTVSNASGQVVFNGNTITLSSVSVAFNASMSGTTIMLLSPNISTTLTVSSTGSPNFSLPITINGAGTVNLNITFGYGTNTFTYTAGTVTHSGTLTLNNGGTYATNGMTFSNGQTGTSATTTLSSDLSFSGNFTITSLPVLNGVGRKLIVGGNLTNNGTGGAFTGTARISMRGTGTISGTSIFGSTVALEINTSGTITLSGSISFLRFIEYLQGTIVSTNSTISSGTTQSFTLNSSGFNLSTYQTTSSPTFLGSFGCTFMTYSCTTAGTTHTFASGNSYRILSGLNLLGTAASPLILRSGTVGVQTNFSVDYGDTLDVGHVSATDINASAGQTIWDYKGILSNTTNWSILPTVPKTIGIPWVR